VLTIGFVFAMFVYMAKQAKQGFFKSREDVVSMFLGLVVVVAVVGFVVNFIERRKGTVDIPGVSNDIKIEENIITDGKGESIDEVVVQKNDSLWKIAESFYGDGYKWTEVAKANNLTNPGVIYVGQKLTMPKIEKIVEVTTSDPKVTTLEKSEYVVLRGDTLWNISIKIYGDGYKWTKIWMDNKDRLNSPDKLEIGMKLLVYGKI